MRKRRLIGVAALLLLTPPVDAQTAADTVTFPFAAFDAASESVLADPHDLVVGPDDRLYVADKLANRIAIMDRHTLEVIGSFGEGELFNPRDIHFDPLGRAVVADTGNSRVAVYGFPNGVPTLVGSLPGVSRTEGAVAHPNGRVYATASGFGSIVAFEKGQAVARASGLSGAHDVDVDADGNLWVADMGNRRIVKFSPDLEILATLDDPKYGWVGPRYLAIDALGRIVVADQDAHRIVLIEPDGTIAGVLGDGRPGRGPNKFDDPEGVAVDESTYFIADSDNNRVVRYRVLVN